MLNLKNWTLLTFAGTKWPETVVSSASLPFTQDWLHVTPPPFTINFIYSHLAHSHIQCQNNRETGSVWNILQFYMSSINKRVLKSVQLNDKSKKLLMFYNYYKTDYLLKCSHIITVCKDYYINRNHEYMTLFR